MVTETNTTARPAPDGPPGLEGGVTLTNPKHQHREAKYDALKAEVIVP